MAAVEFDVDGGAFLAGLAAKLQELELRTEGDVLRLGHKAARNMRQLAAVDTGRMRNSIGVNTGRDGRGMYVDVGPSVEYAIFVEYGTSRMEAQPFVRPGLAQAVADGLR